MSKRYTEADLQELLKDKARLDWLADVKNTIGNVMLPTDIVERNLSSLRDAIDEAMRQEKVLKTENGNDNDNAPPR